MGKAAIRLLGLFALEVDGRSVPLGGLRQRAVLAHLAIHANDVVARDTLIEELWAGEPPSSAVSTLQGYVSHLRQALRGCPLEIASRGPGYVLVAADDQIDARVFVRAVTEAQQLLSQRRPAETIEVLNRGLALWRGPALVDFVYEEFARPEAARLDELRLTAISLRIESQMSLGQHQVAAGELGELVLEHPLREDFRAQLMRALVAGGRRVEALRVYQEARSVLADLGLDPGLSLQRLERAILAQDPSVEGYPTFRTAPNRLPLATTSFVGQEEALKSIADLVRGRRLVTITGPGGIGKTRLAVEVARALTAEQPDGAFLIELSNVTDPGSVAHTVAQVLGAQVQPNEAVLETLEWMAGHRSALIVLDNCEHVLEAAAAVASVLLKNGPELKIIATSRQRLGLFGETVWSMTPLEVPNDVVSGSDGDLDPENLAASDAMRLFLERADMAWPGFSLSEDNAAPIARICQRLDGIPLAIELAAACLRTLSVHQIAERLDDRFRLLTTGDRGALARYRTLEASVEWSHDLLNEDEKVLFRRLAVFTGSFDLAAVEAVCSDQVVGAVSMFDLCCELVSQSLLSRENGPQPEPRYRMLETIRQFGLDRLEASGEKGAMRAAHARAFTERALEAVTHLNGPAFDVWANQLDADRADIRAALEWLVEEGDPPDALKLATSLWLYWRHRDEPREGRLWLGRALARGEPGREERLGATVAQARLALLDDDLNGAEDACTLGLTLAGPGDNSARAHLAAVQAEVLRFRGGDRDRAERLAREAVRRFHEDGDGSWEGHARRVLGQLEWDRGNLTRASTLIGQCLNLFETCGDAKAIAGAKFTLAGLARDRGESAEAALIYEENPAAFRAANQPGGQAEAARQLGILVLASGHLDRAEELGRESLRVCEHLGSRRGAGRALALLGMAAFERRDLQSALEFFGRSLDHLRTEGYPAEIAAVTCSAAHVALHLGLLQRAEGLLSDSKGSASGFRNRQSSALMLLARVRTRQGNAAGLSLASEAVDLAREAGDARATAAALEALAEATLLQGGGSRARLAARLVLVARYTCQAAGLAMTRVEAVDHESTVAAVTTALEADSPEDFIEAWHALRESGAIDISVFDALIENPGDLSGPRRAD